MKWTSGQFASAPLPLATHMPSGEQLMPAPHSSPPCVHCASHVPEGEQKKPAGQVSAPPGVHVVEHAAGAGTSLHTSGEFLLPHAASNRTRTAPVRIIVTSYKPWYRTKTAGELLVAHRTAASLTARLAPKAVCSLTNRIRVISWW
ncbi:MAG TPA: hypothetical protein VGF94_29085 [Kofleriaceae bacterium]